MKTLNEVIKALELCTSPALEDGCIHGCPYSDLANECACDYMAIPQMQNDALTYLKEYQEIKQHLACMDRGEIRGNATQITNNPSLTWEDLRQMKGKPVWIHFNNGTKGHWDIVRDIGRIYEGEDRDMWMWFYVGDKKAKTTYGKWQAYKKKRE